MTMFGQRASCQTLNEVALTSWVPRACICN